MENGFKKISKELMHDGNRVHLYNVKVEVPTGKQVVWENIEHLGASAIIPIDEDGKIILVRQYRLAADDLVLEIPAGVLDHADEDPYDCAKRELEEETGYDSDDIKYLFKFYPAIGYSDEVIHVYEAINLRKTAQNLDEDEFVEIERYTVDECVEMISKGEIVDSKTISAILFYANETKK